MDLCQGDDRFNYADILVNLDDDPTEVHNLLDKHPEVSDKTWCAS